MLLQSENPEIFILTDEYRYFNFDNFSHTVKTRYKTECGLDIIIVYMHNSVHNFFALRQSFDELFDVNSYLLSKTLPYQGDTKYASFRSY